MALITSAPSRGDRWSLVSAGAVAIALSAICAVLPSLLPRLYRLHRVIASNDIDTMPARVYEMTAFFITAGVGVIAFLVYPFLTSICRRVRAGWRSTYTIASLGAACVFLGVFIIHFGNRQFGLYDFGILIDTGWRQSIGQRPYVDFLTATPPGFNLGIKYAFELFGVSWDAQLYVTALLASVSFLWMYWLLLRITGRRNVAFWAAFAAEAAITLELCFWWYNDETQTIALLFFLSCILLSRQSRLKGAQISYWLSLSLLALMKPNIAATLGICGIALTFIITSRKLNLLLVTCASAATAALILITNRIPVAAMLAEYRAAAIEHGMTLFGLRSYDEPRKVAALVVWLLALAFPIALMIPVLGRSLREGNWREIAYLAFFPAMLVIALYGLATNSDMEDLQLAGIFIAGVVILFSRDAVPHRPVFRRIYVALLFAMLASDLYAGVQRWRVHGIGAGMFFEWTDAENNVNSSFFGDLHAGRPMSEATKEIQTVVQSNEGPYFMGPRLESYYAVERIPSPMHLPIVWEPGTFFARADEGKLTNAWRQHNFATLIFLKDDYTYYTPEFLSVIHSTYDSDERYPELTVYHRKAK